jgi:hypothetical protein
MSPAQGGVYSFRTRWGLVAGCHAVESFPPAAVLSLPPGAVPSTRSATLAPPEGPRPVSRLPVAIPGSPGPGAQQGMQRHEFEDTLTRITSGVFEVGLTLQAALDQPAALRRAVERAIELLDGTVRDARTAAFAWHDHGDHVLADAGEPGVAVRPGTLARATVDSSALLESSRHQRLADIDRRLAELRQTRPEVPGDDPAPQAGRDAQWCAREARRHWQESVAHLQQTRQLTAEALCWAAHAHDRAAWANERSARAGIGDVAEHNRMAGFTGPPPRPTGSRHRKSTTRP